MKMICGEQRTNSIQTTHRKRMRRNDLFQSRFQITNCLENAMNRIP